MDYTKDYGWYSVDCAASCQTDLDKASALVDLCLHALATDAFSELGAEWVPRYHFDITLSNDVHKYKPEDWSISTSTTGASMTVLAFSLYRGNELTYLGEPCDEHTAYRLFMHELSHGYLHKLLALRNEARGGWMLYDSGTPHWVPQGFGDYLALTYTDEHARTVTLSLYLAYARQHPDLVSFSTTGIRVTDPYRGGALLIKFIYDTYGKRKVMDLLDSTQPTFYQALVDVLGIGLGHVETDWQIWCSQNGIKVPPAGA